jgi:hypothetical protein
MPLIINIWIVLIQSIPSDIHERTAGEILTRIQEEFVVAGNSSRLLRTLKVVASPRGEVGNRRGKEQDMSLTPAGLSIGRSILDNGRPTDRDPR